MVHWETILTSHFCMTLDSRGYYPKFETNNPKCILKIYIIFMNFLHTKELCNSMKYQIGVMLVVTFNLIEVLKL